MGTIFRPSLDKKQNAPSPTALSSAGDFHEMKTGGIVVCSTLVALVYIPEYSYGRFVTHTLRSGLAPSVWRMPPKKIHFQLQKNMTTLQEARDERPTRES
ncbi:hypothetical protein IFM89_036510 [Coptis chinensis]|uniref:Uncharacterized protein n=1 Tax=Coptis chinensis TaxID=261450 RepID=A0A835I5Y4_9MAGN|nr:hypothetical protein IFM89_036510 [Coptis chinensis]